MASWRPVFRTLLIVVPFFGMFCLNPPSFPCLDKLAVAFSFSSERRVYSVECSERMQCVLLVVVIADSKTEHFRP